MLPTRLLLLPSVQSAQLFLERCDPLRAFFTSVATLDALAGFAVATHPSAAPPGCTFCRPTFAASVPAPAQAASSSGSCAAPPLRLQGVWSPALLASGVDSIQPNSLQLGGTAGESGGGGGERLPGVLLLTGANTGGKSTLLRATCLAAIMAQARSHNPLQTPAAAACTCNRWRHLARGYQILHAEQRCRLPCSAPLPHAPGADGLLRARRRSPAGACGPHLHTHR